MKWTKEKIAALPAAKRAILYANARALGTTDGEALATLIADTGLPFSEGGALTENDPIYIKMHQIVFSDEGRKAAIGAADLGLPPLAGVDPLINATLKNDYGNHNMGPANAGYAVAALMRHLGYKEAGKSAALPPGCVARTGMLWQK